VLPACKVSGPNSMEGEDFAVEISLVHFQEQNPEAGDFLIWKFLIVLHLE